MDLQSVVLCHFHPPEILPVLVQHLIVAGEPPQQPLKCEDIVFVGCQNQLVHICCQLTLFHHTVGSLESERETGGEESLDQGVNGSRESMDQGVRGSLDQGVNKSGESVDQGVRGVSGSGE